MLKTRLDGLASAWAGLIMPTLAKLPYRLDDPKHQKAVGWDPMSSGKVEIMSPSRTWDVSELEVQHASALVYESLRYSLTSGGWHPCQLLH